MGRIIIVCWKNEVYNLVIRILCELGADYTALPAVNKIIAKVECADDLELLRKAGLIHVYQ